MPNPNLPLSLLALRPVGAVLLFLVPRRLAMIVLPYTECLEHVGFRSTCFGLSPGPCPTADRNLCRASALEDVSPGGMQQGSLGLGTADLGIIGMDISLPIQYNTVPILWSENRAGPRGYHMIILSLRAVHHSWGFSS